VQAEQDSDNRSRAARRGGAIIWDRCHTVVRIKPQPSMQKCEGCGTVWVAGHDDVLPLDPDKACPAKEALTLVRTRPGITIAEMADAMGIKRSGAHGGYLYRVMQELEAEGQVVKRDSDRGWQR
jgi:hypothetical protein